MGKRRANFFCSGRWRADFFLAGGGAAAFGGASKVANSPTGSGEKRTEFSAKEEARRQGVTVAQIMHARAHADSSPLTKVRF